jgi:tetratricopeptide (TPR) repeat protein
MKRALPPTLFLLGLGLLAPLAQAQTGAARGTVVDEQGQPVADASVRMEFLGGITRQFETKTNKKGEFTQVGLRPGPYRVTVSREGFAPAASEVQVPLGDATRIEPFRLAPAKRAEGDAGAEELQRQFAEALRLQNAGKLEEAEATYKALLDKAPDVPEVHVNLGFVYAARKDWASAEASYLKALELRPGAADVVAALGAVYRETGRLQKAVDIVEKTASENPADARAQFNKGTYLLAANETERAIAAFEAAITADPAMAEAYFRLGTLMVGQSRIPEAIAHLEKYLSLGPTKDQNVATARGLLQAIRK